MIGHAHLEYLRFGLVDVKFMFVYPLRSYIDNFMMIQRDLAEICEFQSKCLTGRVEIRERESRERDDYNVWPCHCNGVVMRWSRPAQWLTCEVGLGDWWG